MNDWKYPGARWWKFDFHTHTPASTDFGRNETESEVTPELWLRKFMEKGIDCVAITDHNSGAWVDILKEGLNDLKQAQPDWYRPIHLFPGVEISANSGVHVLAIFDKDKSTSDVDSLLGAVGYHGTKGETDTETTKSLTDVVNLVAEMGAIPIPAHVDKPKGLFSLTGTSLKPVLENSNVCAVELCDQAYSKPELYNSTKTNWTEVVGSDMHGFVNSNFGAFTWVKMDEPSIEGLQLALIDGVASVGRDVLDNPNSHAEFVIEELIIDGAKYIGRPDPLRCTFSPFLNTIIGGRGSGKSTLLELMRLVLRRKQEMPTSLQDESHKYFHAGEGNLLTSHSKVSLIYRKRDARFRLNWSANADDFSLEEDVNEDWVSSEGDIRSLFPARIYSQKQIFELAKNPQALIGIVDEDRAVEYEKFALEQQSVENKYKQNTRELMELHGKISQQGKFQGELKDYERQIVQIEKSGHKAVLQNYRKREQQINEISELENGWQEMAEWLKSNQDEIASYEINEALFADDPDILSALNLTNDRWASLNEQLRLLTTKAQSIIAEWMKEKENADWFKKLRSEMSQYEQLRTQFEQQGIDPDKYPLLIRQHKAMQKQLHDIETFKGQKEKLMLKRKALIKCAEKIREALTKNRKKFLKSILQESKAVHIDVVPFGENLDDVEKTIRTILQCQEHFERDIKHLIGEGFSTLSDVQNLKNSVQKIRREKTHAQDRRFVVHLESLPQESIDDLMLWFPDDGLNITFGLDNQKIQSGSPGQKTAALLAFILSYGHDPLLLDQPEDDLDNELVYDLIVQQLRKTKSNRQIIVITHNANIAVNGDSEMVIPMVVRSGQSHVENQSSIQNNRTRAKICDILEGGQQAFEQRYKRIHLERGNV